MTFNQEVREEVNEVKNEVKKIKNQSKEQSWAMITIKEAKKINNRLFIMWLVTFIAFIGLLGYTIYLLNDIETVVTETNESYDMSTENGNNNYIGGDNNGEINNN